MSDPEEPTRHLLVQAPVPAVSGDGLTVVIIGTAVFGVAALVCGLLHTRLTAAGHESWLGIVACGFVLGLIGVAYCVQRRRRGPATGASNEEVSVAGPSRPDPR